ncbi:hypothetical protein chiPu_0025712, partial [Chiloscyllium punctatum]|nr:hypothetical protein [Chiloscyllium punctatum]
TETFDPSPALARSLTAARDELRFSDSAGGTDRPLLHRSMFQEHQRITYKLEDTSLRLKDEMDLYKKMVEKMRRNRQEFQKEREMMQE